MALRKFCDRGPTFLKLRQSLINIAGSRHNRPASRQGTHAPENESACRRDQHQNGKCVSHPCIEPAQRPIEHHCRKHRGQESRRRENNSFEKREPNGAATDCAQLLRESLWKRTFVRCHKPSTSAPNHPTAMAERATHIRHLWITPEAHDRL